MIQNAWDQVVLVLLSTLFFGIVAARVWRLHKTLELFRTAFREMDQANRALVKKVTEKGRAAETLAVQKYLDLEAAEARRRSPYRHPASAMRMESQNGRLTIRCSCGEEMILVSAPPRPPPTPPAGSGRISLE